MYMIIFVLQKNPLGMLCGENFSSSHKGFQETGRTLLQKSKWDTKADGTKVVAARLEKSRHILTPVDNEDISGPQEGAEADKKVVCGSHPILRRWVLANLSKTCLTSGDSGK